MCLTPSILSSMWLIRSGQRTGWTGWSRILRNTTDWNNALKYGTILLLLLWFVIMLLIYCSLLCFGCNSATVILRMTTCIARLARNVWLLALWTSGLAIISAIVDCAVILFVFTFNYCHFLANKRVHNAADDVLQCNERRLLYYNNTDNQSHHEYNFRDVCADSRLTRYL